MNKDDEHKIIANIHLLYMRGKISREQHNCLIFQAKKGVTAFEL